VRVHAGLADDPELVEPLDQRRPDRRALADARNRLDVLEAPGELVHVLGVVLPHRDVVPANLVEAR
jgi:hypothetical protein